MSRVYLLDMSGLAHWLYHAGNKDSRDDAGDACGMLNGWRQWIFEFLDRFEPTHIAAIYDGASNWRKDPKRGGSAEYKAQRKAVDEDLKTQLRRLPAEVGGIGIHCMRYDEFEADDVLATFTALHASEETPVVIVSSDKDLAQLIGDHVSMFDPRPTKDGQTHLYDTARATEKWGVPPHRMAELLALVGDASDNVSGVEGWGKVRAVNAINQTRSWPELVRKARAGQLEKIDAKAQASLISQLDAYHAAHKLVSLVYTVPITETLDDLRWRHPAEFGNSADTGTDRDKATSQEVPAVPDLVRA